MSDLKAREILLKHLDKGSSERVKKFHRLVDYDLFISAMEEYAELKIKQANESRKCCEPALHKQSVMHFKMFGRKLTLLDVFWLIVAIAYTVSIVKHFIVP